MSLEELEVLREGMIKAKEISQIPITSNPKKPIIAERIIKVEKRLEEMSIEELRSLKSAYKTQYESGVLDKKEYVQRREGIRLALRKLGVRPVMIPFEEVVYRMHHELGYEPKHLCKLLHKSENGIKKILDSYEEKQLFEEFKKSRTLKGGSR